MTLRLMATAVGALVLLVGCGGGGDDEPANGAPALGTASLTGTEDLPLTAQLVASDPDRDAVTFARATDAQHGQVTVSAGGSVTYTPAANYFGADSFSVSLSDGQGGTSTGTVTVTVAAVNDLPVIPAAHLSVAEDTPLAAQLAATDVDDGVLTFARTLDAQHGQLTVSAGGAVTYTPVPNYFGPDTFTVSARDAAGAESVAAMTITVTPVNDLPAVTSTPLTVAEDGTLVTQLTAVDPEGDTFTFVSVPSIAHGVLTLSDTGVVNYFPAANYFGADSFRVRLVETGGATTGEQTIDIDVVSVNDAPVANDDAIRIATGDPMTLAVATNDTEVEGDTVQVSVLTQPRGGTVAVGAANVLTFTPENAFAGPIEFTYRLTDAGGAFDDATVRAVIGDFQGLVFLADDVLPNRPEIFLYDGLQVQRIATYPNPYEIVRFAISGDGTKLAYVVSGPNFDEVWFKPLASPAPAVRIWTTAPTINGASALDFLRINHSGSYVVAEDRYSTAVKRIYIVNTATGASQLLGADEPGVVQASLVHFNPYDDDQVVLRGQIGGNTPPDFTNESFTTFVADAAAPRTLTQIGANYPQLLGSGSGNGFWYGANGRYIYHVESEYAGNPTTRTLLVYDNVTQNESVMYRRPMGTERGTSGSAGAALDGSKVCFPVGEPGATNQDGPARFHVGSGAVPAATTPISPIYPSAGLCWFASDNDTVVMKPITASGNRQEVFAVSATTPGTPVKLSHTLGANEEVANFWVARSAPRLVMGYRIAPSPIADLFSLPVSGAGPAIPFATGFENVGLGNNEINNQGTLLAYAQTEGAVRKLRLLSTQTLNYSIPIQRAGGIRGIAQFRWVPIP